MAVVAVVAAAKAVATVVATVAAIAAAVLAANALPTLNIKKIPAYDNLQGSSVVETQFAALRCIANLIVSLFGESNQ